MFRYSYFADQFHLQLPAVEIQKNQIHGTNWDQLRSLIISSQSHTFYCVSIFSDIATFIARLPLHNTSCSQATPGGEISVAQVSASRYWDVTHVFNIRAFTGSRFRGKSNPHLLPPTLQFSRYPFRRLWQVEPLLPSDQRAFSYQRVLNLQWNCFDHSL